MDELGLGIGEYDLNEIESRLYSQVFHGSVEEEADINNVDQIENMTSPVTGKRKNFRYFGNQNQSNSKSSVQITIDHSNHIPEVASINPNNITILTPSNTNSKECSNGYHNITVNQFTIPVILSTTSQEVGNYQDFRKFDSSNILADQALTKKQKKYLRGLKRRRKQDMKHIKKVTKQKNSKIIFISDESDSESMKLGEKVTLESKKTVESKNQSKPNIEDTENDIIYIPPPPVEVINIDEESQGSIDVISNSQHDNTFLNQSLPSNDGYHPKERNELLGTPESTSNDFLDNTNIENACNRFNFGLHGSDFNSSLEFVKPNNPTDFCETESSCSTNDQNKDIDNSAISIVFDEVEFPRTDIFADKNLDSFSSFITPKRSNKNIDTTNSNLLQTRTSNDKHICYDSSASSTESDYEPTENRSYKNLDTNLPTLSPMIPSLMDDTKSSNIKRKKLGKTSSDTSTPTKKISNKRKSNNSSGGQSSSKISQKKKKVDKTSEEFVIDSNDKNEVQIHNGNLILNTDKEVIKEKQKKHIDQMETRNDSSNEGMENPSDCNNGTLSDQTEHEDSRSKKKKKKKKKSRKNTDSIPEVGVENILDCLNSSTSTVELSISTEGDKNDSVPIATEARDDCNHYNEDTNDRYLNVVVDPSDIHLYNELLPQNNTLHAIHQIEEKEDGDVIIVDQMESKAADVILIDDMSDSDVEIIENIDGGSELDNLTNLQLANCTTNFSNRIIQNMDPNFIAMDHLNNFNVKAIQSKQSDDPQKWIISGRDRFVNIIEDNKGPRCTRCRRRGHYAFRCLEKPLPPPCSLCSDTSHQEPRCPNKMCRQCGNPGEYSLSYCHLCFKYRHVKCNLCNVAGHLSNTCPDLWRRYHLTIDEGPIIIPNEQVMRPRNQQWCSGCAQQGHLEHECNDINYHREFPATRPDIIVYRDILNENSRHGNVTEVSENPPRPLLQNNLPLYRIPSLMDNLVTLSMINRNTSLGRNVSLNIPKSNTEMPIFVPNPCVPLNMQQNIFTPNLIDQMRCNFQNSNLSSQNQDIIQEMSDNFQNSIIPGEHNKPDNSNHLNKYDMRKIKELFMSMPRPAVKRFLKKQMDELDTKIINYSPKVLRHKLFKYDRNIEKTTEKIKKERLFWYRVLNMFIFGIHNLNDGKLHERFLRNFLKSHNSLEFDERQRRSLFTSYSYIFGVDKNINVNYYRLIKLLIDKCQDNKVIKPLN